MLRLCRLNEAIGQLVNGSIIQRHITGETLQIHRVTQKAFLYGFDVKDRCRAFHNVVLRLNAVFPMQDEGHNMYSFWEQCEKYIHHVIAVVNHYKTNLLNLGYPVTLSELIRRSSWFLFEKHEFSEATSMVHVAIKICESATTLDLKTGYAADWYIPRLLSDLYSQLGSFIYETNVPGHGTQYMLKAQELRRPVYEEFEDDFDARALRFYHNNHAAALMAEGDILPAMAILETIYTGERANGLAGGLSILLLGNLALAQHMATLDTDAIETIHKAISQVATSGHSEAPEMGT